jgi:hypothetical protein
VIARMRPATRYTVTASVKTTADVTGHVVLTEAGVAVQGGDRATSKQVT